MATCAFIGLGNMGYPMAGHLATAGHAVRVYNRTTAKAERWSAEHGQTGGRGTHHTTPAEAATGADFVFICVGADDDVRSVVYGSQDNDGNGALGALEAGAVIVDHTTASATLARELAEACRGKGIGFVDAPISGGQAGAESGQLSVMCGGSIDDFAKAEPIIDHYAKAVTLLGEAGAGQQTKMVNQILCAGAIQGAAEALAFGERAGLDMDLVLQAVTQGAAGSWYLSNRGETMVRDEFDFGFAVDWMAKDLGLVKSEAESLGADTPLTDLTAGYLAETQQAGDNRMDATAIIRRYRS
ncbi:MAG: NAD(P)-dependent oxidoreductase [Acidimicrobiales bacterium]